MTGFNHTKRGFIPPCTPGATAETVSLYNYLQSLCGTSSYCVGVADYFRIDGFAPQWTNYQGQFQTMSGKLPAFLQLEYVDVNDSTNGVAKNANLKARMLEVYASGGFVTLHHHSANPVNNSIANSLAGGAGGNHQDRTGSPVAACVTGGAKRAEFIAYCDRLAAFLNDLTLDGVKCPVILRWFHEINGEFFWWNGSDRRVDCVQMFKDLIDRLKAQGVTNALYSLNFEVSAPDANIANWYLGDDYLDFVSGDFYSKNAAPTYPGATVGRMAEAQEYTRILAMGKPFYWAEIGYQYTMNGHAGQWAKNTGGDMQLFPGACMLGLWMPYSGAGVLNGWAPWVGGGSEADVSLMAADRRCITRERVTWDDFTA